MKQKMNGRMLQMGCETTLLLLPVAATFIAMTVLSFVYACISSVHSEELGGSTLVFVQLNAEAKEAKQRLGKNSLENPQLEQQVYDTK
jgi:cell division protein FtsB